MDNYFHLPSRSKMSGVILLLPPYNLRAWIRTSLNFENSALLRYYAASTAFFFGFLTLEDGNDRLFRNVLMELPLLTA